MNLRSVLPKFALFGALSGAALSVVACGNATFQKQEFSATAIAAQYTKPKIDILIAQDNSSSMLVPLQNMKGQLASFISSLNGNWDYHFTVVPLQSAMSINSKWIIAQDCTGVQNCVTAAQSAGFNNAPSNAPDAGWINSVNQATANSDLGFQYMQSNLSDSSMTSSGFLRSDAALAVIVLSNGDDISGMSYPTDYTYLNGQNGMMVPDDNSANAKNSFNIFKTFLSTLKGGTSLLKFYSVVAQSWHITSGSLCNGQYAWAGTRYMNMSNSLNGATYDLCSSGLSSVLNNISAQINSLIQAYEFNYAVLNNGEPIVSSITVTKNGASVPQSTTNGWSYVGYTTQFLSYAPQQSNQATGYMIKLNGNAVYSGSDVITINYQKK